ncbi:hypothetical protein C8F04DRAFT_1212966 [Mycena alexandri]|uniref:CxC2-like cysteine cluster KDZ transposase-associated domain-containing protein n=1 Tax=Mycena alexandri TaxID=1745969 RepID=A0AAD6SDN1_9AGAR|nr:hypothetical protein C8F04DRAFT_1212966 [Mycena alexandri]
MNRGGRPRANADNTGYDVSFQADADTTIAADRGVYFSTDGRRQREELMNITHKKRRLEPTQLDDRLATWIPVPEDNVDMTGGEGGNDAEVADVVAGEKRKHYDGSLDPMSKWRPEKQVFMDALLWHNSLGDHKLCCDTCGVKSDDGSKERVRLFKCRMCGEFMQCGDCCLEWHERTPLHVLDEWNGNFWEMVELGSLGLVYQLGHGGARCLFPDLKICKMVVLEYLYVHRVQYQYCGCKKSDTTPPLQQLLRNKWYPATTVDPATCTTFGTLETFRMENIVGNMNVSDFVTTMERRTNATGSTGMNRVPHRFKEFMRMSRQWAFLTRMKRAGCRHDKAGACPQDGRNLPPGWRDVEPKFRFLYMLIVALDANFKLKNRMRANAKYDPPLGPGWEYFVEPQEYKKHLKSYVPEKDISSCIAFAALLQKDTRSTAGLRVTGVGGCVCARHECVRPNGIGDLQKGERYTNMDFIVFSALLGFSLLWLTISYDIACQWRKNLLARMEKLPEALQLSMKDIRLQCALPVWHAGSHEEECCNAHSLSVKPGVGKSDSEGVERTWAVLNPAAYHTKDMNIGNREDHLNDKIDNHNFLKNIGLSSLAERAPQVAAFKEVSSTVEKELREKWQGEINDWLADSTKANPYVLDKSAPDTPSEAQVRADLKKDEEAKVAAGRAPLHGTSATAFLTAGMQLEDSQHRILAELRGLPLIAPDRESKIQELRLALLKKIAKLRKLQGVFMPGAPALIANEESLRDADTPPPRPEKIKLWMPHELDEARRATGCARSVVDIETKLRSSQCLNALIHLRSRLHSKQFFLGFRYSSSSHMVGQHQATKANTLHAQIGDRVNDGAEKYRKGYGALLKLQGNIDPQFRPLKDSDLQLDGDDGESDRAARKKLAMIGSGRGARAPRNAPGTTRKVMSWIWTAQGGANEGEEGLHASVRVEWCRARARKVRWEEEVWLVREEMRRVIRYLDWQAEFWRARVESRPDAEAGVRAGVRAYALKQAALCTRLGLFFRSEWETPTNEMTKKVVAGGPPEHLEGADLDDFFDPVPPAEQ